MFGFCRYRFFGGGGGGGGCDDDEIEPGPRKYKNPCLDYI